MWFATPLQARGGVWAVAEDQPLVNLRKKPQHRRAARIMAPIPAAVVTAVVIKGVTSVPRVAKSIRLVSAA